MLTAAWLALKLAGGAIFNFLKNVPWQVWLALGIGLAFLYYGHVKDKAGYARAESHFVAIEKVRLAKIAELEARGVEVVEKEVVVYRDVVKTIKGETREIVREIPVLVRAECDWPGGFRVLHDAATTGKLPDDPAGASATADPVEATAATQTIVENYASCRADQARLTALQNILKGIPNQSAEIDRRDSH